jgi:predicted Zn-dependent protease
MAIEDDPAVRMLARASLLVLSLAACGWFAIGARQARDTQRAAAIVNRAGSIGASAAARARALLRSAGTLNPDLTPDILRGQLAVDLNQNVAAERILGNVVREEPMNLDAWVQLALAATQNGDRPTFLRAGRVVAKLEPQVK